MDRFRSGRLAGYSTPSATRPRGRLRHPGELDGPLLDPDSAMISDHAPAGGRCRPPGLSSLPASSSRLGPMTRGPRDGGLFAYSSICRRGHLSTCQLCPLPGGSAPRSVAMSPLVDSRLGYLSTCVPALGLPPPLLGTGAWVLSGGSWRARAAGARAAWDGRRAGSEPTLPLTGAINFEWIAHDRSTQVPFG